jgi:transcriptional regulator with XRE-family HTH domain
MELKRLGTKELEMIGENIRIARNEQGIKQSDMAQEIGVGRNVIYKIENGLGSLSVEYLYYISQILGKPMDYFLSEHGEPDRKVETRSCSGESEVKERLMRLIEGRNSQELSMIERVITAFFVEGD